ncbi:MAG TPA: oligosaccharide flippase family protein [Microbacterium sp.]|nr:oligosaccharide flippase family protein [Microbacterium sp.]
MRTPVDAVAQRTSRAQPDLAAGAGGITGAVITTYAARFASMIAYVALLPVVLTTFGAEAYGLYMLTVAVGALFQQDLGVGGATTRFIGVAAPSNDFARMRRVAATSNVFFLAAAVILSSATALVFALTIPRTQFGHELSGTAWILAVLGVANVFILLSFSSNRQILTGIGRLNDVNYLLIGLAVFRVALTLLVCWAGVGIVAVAAVDVLGILAFGIATYALRRTRAPQITARPRDFRWSVFRELFAVSAQLMILGLAGVVIMQVGGILTALMLPIAFTALYAAGQRIYLLVKEVTNSLATAILPTASMREGGAAGTPIGEMYLRGTGYANMLMMVVLVPVVVFMPQIMGVWLGPSGVGAAIVAQILVLSMFANNNHLLAVPILTAQGSVRGYAVLHTVWAVTGTALAVVLGAPFGLTGIALGLVLPILLLEPIYVAIALRRLDLRVKDFAVRCLLLPFGTVAPAAAALLMVSLLDPPIALIPVIGAAWAITAITLYYFIALDATTRSSLRSALTRRLRGGRTVEDSP